MVTITSISESSVFFTVDVDGVEYPGEITWAGSREDAQAYLDANVETYRQSILDAVASAPGVARHTPALADLKAAACARIEATRLSLETAGVWIDWPDGARSKIQTRDERDWRNINGIASRGLARLTQGQTDEDWFRDADNIDHTLPLPLQAMALGYQAAAAVSAIAKVAQKAKDTINAPDVTTAEQVAAIEAAIDWPA